MERRFYIQAEIKDDKAVNPRIFTEEDGVELPAFDPNDKRPLRGICPKDHVNCSCHKEKYGNSNKN